MEEKSIARYPCLRKYIMKNILKNPQNAERLLRMTSDAMLLIDEDGVCLEVADYNVRHWFLKEEFLVGKNVFRLMPDTEARREFHLEFEKVRKFRMRSVHSYELNVRGRQYYFKCIMYPFDGMVLCQYRDITERMLRKYELEEKNYLLSEIQKAAQIGQWTFDSDTALFTYQGNAGFLDEWNGRSLPLTDYRALIIPEDVASFDVWVRKAVHGDLAESITYRLLYQEQLFYICLKAYAHRREENGNVHLEGFVQNITQTQRNRNDISLLTHAINNSTEDIFCAREDGTLLFANRRFKEHHGIAADADVTTLKFADLASSPDNPQVWENLKRSVRRDTHENHFIVYHPLEDRPEILAYEGNAYWVTSDEGEQTLWAFGHDVSARVKSEREAKRFTQILDKVVDNLPAGVVVKDIENGFRYLYRNRESYKHIDNQYAIGKDDFDFHPREVAERKRAQDMQVAETGIPMHWIEEQVTPDGKVKYADKQKIKIVSDDFPPILVNIDWDITEEEQMRRDLQKAKEKAETSDRLKSAFLANMSHEIRTPLNAIVGFSRLIAESDSADERQEFYRIVESNNERLLGLINEILDLSKIEVGMTDFTIHPLHLYRICQDVYTAHCLSCPPGVELRFDPSDTTVLVEADKNRLFQVISNLISNAYKFTTQGSVSYGYVCKEGMLEFYVTDTGAGIAPEKLNHVFERFVKADESVQGTGLGLSISKLIIERMGGRIWVTSRLGEGTTFRFTLPLSEGSEGVLPPVEEALPTADLLPHPSAQASPAGQVHAVEEAPAGSASILVAEDADCNYTLIKLIVGKEYHLERAKDGMEAVSLFDEMRPDLILMDMRMPNLGGLDATRIIRQLSADVPIIALSAHADEEDQRAAMEAGCNDYLVKPFTQEGLKAAIRRALEGK